ncbi:hypothetical protein EZV62_003808 [Acer yangbiense]|uniref:BED-type domain-containing protein n=1 Tax=Acer yangbiense TaxID=1000413 RepID=A0A5C7II05_9ROSI|nr:hypothetical protein EZV62_003808 [Acer yangbiense]
MFGSIFTSLKIKMGTTGPDVIFVDKDFDGSSKKGTSHLRNHFKSCQKKRNGAGDKPAEAGNSMNPIAIKEKSVMDQQLDNLDLTRMIVKYGVMSLDSTQELHAYNEERKKLCKYFEKLSCHFCLTIDQVPTRWNDHYFCFTVYFIDDDWKLKRNSIGFSHTDDDQTALKCLKKELLEWGINKNISSMVSDTFYYDTWYVNGREIPFIGQETSSKNETFRIAKDGAKSLGKEVTAEVILTKQQLKDMDLENDGIVALLEIALGFKEAFSEFENMDPDFKSINLTKEQWDHIRDHISKFVRKNGEWIPVTSAQGTLVVNLGDVIQVLSNNKVRSATHRVESSHIAGKETVGLDLGCSSSQMKKRKLRSDVWEHFHKSKDKDGNDRARCNLCDKDFDGSSKKGTSHLRNHFKSCQKRRNGAGDKPAEAGNSMNPIAIEKKSVMDQQLDNLDLTRMILKYCVASLDSTQELHAYNEERKKLCKYFEKLLCRFCLTIDKVPTWINEFYFCFTVYFIDDDWKLKRNIIGFIHTGDDQTALKCLKKVLLEWGINKNISSMVNNTLYYDMWNVNEREIPFIGQGSLLFNGTLLCIDSLKIISYSYYVILFYIKKTLHGRMTITETSSKNETFRIAKDGAKSLGKEVTAEGIPTKQQLEDIDHEALETYEDLTDESFLKHWSYKTANMYFPMLCSLYKKALVLLKKQKIGLYSDGKNLCFSFTKHMERNWCQSNLVLAVAAVLDPRFKMDVVKYWYKKIYGSECETQLTTFTNYFIGVYNEYEKGTKDEKISSISYKMLDPSGKPHKSSHDLDHVRSPNFELDLYLEDVKFPLIEDFDILKWWQVNAQYFPTLARMARDFLAIQISGLPSDEMDEISCLVKDLVSDEDEEAESEFESESFFN